MIDLEAAQLQAIADAFELGTVSATKHTGKVYALHTTHGKFALRFSNAGATLGHLLATHDARVLLADAGLPVLPPLRTADGTTIVEANGLFGDLQPWIARTDDGGSWEHLVIAAEVLPRLKRFNDRTCRPAEGDIVLLARIIAQAALERLTDLVELIIGGAVRERHWALLAA